MLGISKLGKSMKYRELAQVPSVTRWINFLKKILKKHISNFVAGQAWDSSKRALLYCYIYNPPVEDTTIKNQRKLQKIEWPELN